MNLLLDSHAFVWWHDEPHKLSPTAFAEISNPNNNVFLSVVTVWELQIKIALNKILELKEIVKFKSKLVRQEGKYFETDKNGKIEDEPYCPKCWEVDKIAVHLRHIEEQYYLCPQCKTITVQHQNLGNQ